MKLGQFASPKPAGPADKVNSFRAGLPSWFWPGLLLVVATLAAYWPAFSAGFIWDDDFYVTQNLALRNTHGLWQIWFDPSATLQYYPLVHTTFWLEYHAWGLNPAGFHIVNVVLHTLGSLLLWRILALLKLPGAWLAAAIFALHPVEVESVAWITERKNVLSALFYFLSALAYFRFCLPEAGPESENSGTGRHWRFYLVSLALYVAALLSKTVTCSLPAALLLVYWWKKGCLQRRDIVPLLPFFLVGISLGLLTVWLEKHLVGAAGTEWSLTFLERSLIAGRAVCFYAVKLIAPGTLAFIYPRWEINALLWWQWLFPAVVAGVLAVLWVLRTRIGRGPLVAVLFFIGTLAPALGFVNVYPMRFSFVADHFQYLASIGLIALLAVLAMKFVETAQATRRVRLIMGGFLLFVLVVLTRQQCGIYQNLETLWTDTLGKNPRSWMAHSNLGRVLVQQNRLGEAEKHYSAALHLKPDEAPIHYNYGNLLARTGRLEEAIAQYQQAIQLAPDKAEAHNNLGSLFNKFHRTDEAIAEFQRAIFYKPDYADAYYNLGNALSAQHKLEAAVAAYQRAVRLAPDDELFQKRLQALGVSAK